MLDFLDMLFQNGVLDEEPPPRLRDTETPPIRSLPQTLEVAVPAEV